MNLKQQTLLALLGYASPAVSPQKNTNWPLYDTVITLDSANGVNNNSALIGAHGLYGCIRSGGIAIFNQNVAVTGSAYAVIAQSASNRAFWASSATQHGTLQTAAPSGATTNGYACCGLTTDATTCPQATDA